MEKKNEDLLVTMTQKQLDDMLYFASYRASRRTADKLFSGIAPFLYDTQEQLRLVISELDYLKLTIQDLQKKKLTTRKKNQKSKKKISR